MSLLAIVHEPLEDLSSIPEAKGHYAGNSYCLNGIVIAVLCTSYIPIGGKGDVTPKSLAKRVTLTPPRQISKNILSFSKEDV